MCTVSWLHREDAGGYELFCNRDERHTRLAALPPRVRELRGVRFIAPTDGDGGGTWVGVNEFGLTLCLLNRYQEVAPFQPSPRTSRGLLLLELMDAASPEAALGRLPDLRLARFQPFTLVAVAARGPALRAIWDGRACTTARDAAPPLTSSSFETPRVIAAREDYFKHLAVASGGTDPLLLRKFHASHFPAAGAYSACLHRADARTVSFSHITVAAEEVKFSYHPDAPCKVVSIFSELLHPIVLPRS
jgi:hypothetical protein